jgi:hypothetical protein
LDYSQIKVLKLASHRGHFCHSQASFNQKTSGYEGFRSGKPAAAFLINLISQLQLGGAAPMIDVQAYAQWLSK